MSFEEEDSYDSNSSDGDGDLMVCPYCRAEVYDDSVSCPKCGNYFSREDAPHSPMPWWVVVGSILGFIVAFFWIFFRT